MLLKKLSRINEVINKDIKIECPEKIKVGVDLGTANVVIIVTDQENNILTAELREAQVVKDGVVLDFLGAKQLLNEMFSKIEKRLNRKIEKVSTGYPPNTDSFLEVNVISETLRDVISVVNEPEAASKVLNLNGKRSCIVDIGGGTTGISIIENNNVLFSDDEASGGHHLNLVLSGHYKIPINEAEKLKKTSDKEKVIKIVRPVIEKFADIIYQKIKNQKIEEIYLVGGSVLLSSIEDIIYDELNIPVIKPDNSLFITPYGITVSMEAQ